MPLLNLPNELFSLICDFLDDDHGINALHQTCRRLHSLLGPALYRHNAQSPDPCSLEWAAIQGCESTARSALDAGIAPTTACFEDLVPIALACVHGHESIVRLMLDAKGVDPNSDPSRWVNPQEDRPGHPAMSLMAYAARGGHLSVCKALMEYGADLQTSTLPLAGKEGHLPVVKFLAELVRDDPGYEKAADRCLDAAAREGHVEVVRYLLETGARLDRRTSYEHALEFASRSGHFETVQSLLSTCDDVTTPRWQEFILAALLAAADENHPAVSDLLRSHLDTERIVVHGGLPRQGSLIKRLFSIAAMCGWADLLRQLLEQGCSPDMILERKVSCIRKYGWTGLTIAAERGHLGVIGLLLHHDADVNLAAIHSSPGLPFASGSRDPPIVLAATNGHMHIVETLLRHGANPNPKTTRKRGFAYDAVRSPEIMHLLLDWGADPSVRPKRGRSLLSDTLRTGSVPMARMLLARNVPLEMPSGYNAPERDLWDPSARDTLFTLAAQNGAPMVEFLLEQGYSVEPGSSEVLMGFASALSRADAALVDLFLDRGWLGDLVKQPYENLFGTIMSARSDVEAAATIMDTLLARGFELKDDLQYHRRRTEYFLGRSDSAYANPDRIAIYQLLLDRGANPVAGTGLETELSTAARNGDRRGVQMMLKSLDRCGLARDDLQRKLAHAGEQARVGFAESLVEEDGTAYRYVERALNRAYWRSVYPVPD